MNVCVLHDSLLDGLTDRYKPELTRRDAVDVEECELILMRVNYGSRGYRGRSGHRVNELHIRKNEVCICEKTWL